MSSAALANQKTPGTLRSYLELCRASNLPTVWTNALCAALLGGGARPAITGIVAISMSLYYLGGMSLNDVLDVEEDRLKKPRRPLPSGRISRAGAIIFTLALFALGTGLLASTANPRALVSGLALIAVIYLYDRLHSKSWLTVLLMASCRALVFVTTGLAVAGAVGRWVALGAAAQFVYIVALTAVARWEKAKELSFKIPPIPWMLAAISLIDGILMAVFVSPPWLLAGIAGAALTRLLQTQVRGD